MNWNGEDAQYMAALLPGDAMCEHVQLEACPNPARLVQIDSHPSWQGDPVDFYPDESTPNPDPLGPFRGAMYGGALSILAALCGWFIRICYITAHP